MCIYNASKVDVTKFYINNEYVKSSCMTRPELDLFLLKFK